MKEGKLQSAWTMGLFVLLALGSMTMLIDTGTAEMTETAGLEISEKGINPTGFFMENMGQWDPEIRFLGETPFGHIGIGTDGVYFNIVNGPGLEYSKAEGLKSVDDHRLGIGEQKASGHVLKYEFQGSYGIAPEGTQKMDHKVSFFLGNDPSKWVQDVPCYREVLIPDLWQNIDLRYYFGDEGPKYDLILSPWADPASIGVKVLGAEDIGFSDKFMTFEGLGGPLLSDTELRVYYDGGEDSLISSQFSDIGNGAFGFELGRYDRSRTVVIDPLIFSTYIGGSYTEYAGSVASNSNGDTYVGGHTYSTDFPTTPGSYSSTDPSTFSDITLFCIDPTGSQLKYSTYIGGGSSDYFDDIVMDENDNPIFIGHSMSTDFPVSADVYQTSNAGSWDMVIVRMEKDLSDILKATYIGGGYYESEGYIHLQNGDVYIACETSSSNYPTTSGAWDTTVNGYRDFAISRLSSDLSELRSSTYLGGNSYEYLGGLTVDSEGDPIIFGQTYSTDYPSTEGAYSTTMSGYVDTVITKVDSTGKEIVCSTFLGGLSSEVAFAIELTSQNEIAVMGGTYSTDFPTQETSYQKDSNGGADVFFAILNHNASSLLRSTLLGGENLDYYGSMSIDDIGDIHFCLTTMSEDLPFTDTAMQDSYNGGWYDLFFGTLSSNLSHLVYGSYLGGSDRDYLAGLTVDPFGNTIIVGDTNSDDFPLSESAIYETRTGENDTFVFKFSILPNSDPLEVHSVKLYSDPEFSDQIVISDIGMTVYVELRGIGCNSSRVEYAVVNITFEHSMEATIKIALLETGVDSGIYRGTFRIPETSQYFEKLDFASRKDHSKKAVLTLDKPNRPSQVYQVGVFNDATHSHAAEVADKNETVHIRIVGTDTDPSSENTAFVNVTSQNYMVDPLLVFLQETDVNTGIFTGTFKVPADITYLEEMYFTSVRNPLLSVKVIVSTHVLISPLEDITSADEDVLYYVQYENGGWSKDVTWTFHSDVDWISFDQGTRVLSGIPGNDDIGKAEIWLTLRDDKGHKDEHNFVIQVKNSIPSLEWGGDTDTLQDEEYNVNFESDDENVGGAQYHLSTNASWLTIDPVFGILTGTPTNEEVGIYYVRVWVDDGNGGKNTTTFELTVQNRNDPPKIVTTDITRVLQGDPYRRDYDSEDIDRGDVHTWSLWTTADWLSMNSATGILTGTPGPEDVGTFPVNVSVHDEGGLFDFHNFTLKVENVNDKPFFTSVPGDSSITSGETYTFDVDARDFDVDDELTYSISSIPESDITIDKVSGEIDWKASIKWFDEEPYNLKVDVAVSDGEFTIKHRFNINLGITLPPESELIFPEDGVRTSFTDTVLEWTGEDPEGDDITYSVYIGVTEVFVSSLKEETLFISDYDGTSISADGLEAGTKYYWTVIPYDGSSFGKCSSGVSSFRVNSPPEVRSIGLQEIKAGVPFKLVISGSDADAEDKTNLRYSLAEGPDGMSISEDTGMIKWTPSSDQVMLYKVVVNVSDGIDHTKVMFTIDVLEGDGSGSISVLLIAGPAVVLILLAVGIFFFVRSRRSKEEEDVKEEDIEEQIIGGFSEEVQAQIKCDVALTPTEAHSHLGKGSKKVSYEELYGMQAPPKQEEGMTTRELKDFISDQIEELAAMEE
ncbi:MAG: putative Ig domain-containing protein [Thermoplasmatota archaeon]